MRSQEARRVAIVAGIFAALFAVRFWLERPTFIGVSFLLVVPVVLAALWFGVPGGVAVAVAAALGFFAVERLDPSVAVEPHTVVFAALVRGTGLGLIGVLVARLFVRQVAMARELEELEATREALRPAVIAPRPALDLAAHYVPAQDGVGGDFFLAAEGPRGSTVLLVGDVVGKGVRAARRAMFVRTSLVTFAPFEDDPARLLRLANAALIDRAGASVDYVTAACVVHRPADATLPFGDGAAGAPPASSPRRAGTGASGPAPATCRCGWPAVPTRPSWASRPSTTASAGWRCSPTPRSARASAACGSGRPTSPARIPARCGSTTGT